MPGGDCVGLDATMEALRKRGHYCVETGWDRNAMRSGNFDLAHIQHCNFSWSYGNYEAVQDVGLPYVLTPVYYPGPLLSGITKEQLREIMWGAKYILPFSNKEAWYMYQADADLMNCHVSVIPNATDESFHSDNVYRPVDVLCVSARGDSDKNVKMVERIVSRLHHRTFHLATGVEHKDLPEVYIRAKVFVNASGSERMSLTIGEALCAGCRVLVTTENWGNEWYEGIIKFEPHDESRLEHLIRWALASPEWDYRPNSAARVITWDWVAEQLERVYARVLQ